MVLASLVFWGFPEVSAIHTSFGSVWLFVILALCNAGNHKSQKIHQKICTRGGADAYIKLLGTMSGFMVTEVVVGVMGGVGAGAH